MTTVAVSTAGATSEVPRADEWLLTAPWWHWLRQQPAPPQQTAPALQKYAGPGFAADFLADPQRRLVFDATADTTAPPPYDAKTHTVTPQATTRLTKLYLPTHHRHYLVAVELHCARPGLPSPDRTRVCEAGFVVRRRRADVPAELVGEAQTRQRAILRAGAQLHAVQRRLAVAGQRGRIGASSLTTLGEQHSRAEQRLADARRELADWASATGLERRLEGWVALGVDGSGQLVPLGERPDPAVRPLPGLGRWVPVSEVGPTLDEATFPLFPLVPDPRDTRHDGTGRCLWFGTVPTIGSDLELTDDATSTDRVPRFDDLSVYEIRCVVRQHDPRCPRREGTRDCHGPLTWSEPTVPYRLAGALDARGTANRPTTITLPSKSELAEGVGFGGVRVQQSADYQLEDAGIQICSFSIPLITIVATFVLRIFLPIVVFLFGLWVLLSLKLCIPPSVSLDAGLEADLEASKPDIDIDADFHAQIDAGLTASFGAMLASGSDGGLSTPSAGDLITKIGNDPATRVAAVRALITKALRSPADDLVYEPRVERAEVFG